MKTTINFKSEQEYKKAVEMLKANNEASQKYLRENKTNAIPSEVWTKFPYAKEVTNELRSAIETYEFVKNPPAKYLLYISEKTHEATTWTGQKLGRVVFNTEYTSNFGDKRISIVVHGINDKTYTGTFYKSSGDYARIKICNTK